MIILKKLRFVISIFLITILTLYILRFTKNSSPVAEKVVEPSMVETLNIELNEIKPEFLFYGNVKGMNEVEIISKLKGKIINVSPKVLDSSNFNKGEIVFQIDNFNYKKELVQLKAKAKELKNELKATKLIYKEVLIQLELSKKDHNRKKKLYGDIITTKQLEDSLLNLSLYKSKALDSKVKLESFQSEIDIIKAKIEIAKRNLNDTKYKAPFDGKVSNHSIEVGTEVLVGKTIGTFINTSILNIEFFVGETVYANLGNVKGKDITVVWRNSSFKRNYIGKVFNIDSTINKDRSGLNMYARLESIDSNDPIRPGIFVEVLISGKAIPKAFLVDESFVYEDNYIFILKDDIPIKRKVQIEGTVGNKIIIKGNIFDGEKIITTRLTNFNEIKKLYSK